MIGIDIFAGVGGLSLGASKSGIDVKYAIELDRYAAETYRANHINANVIVDDIRNVLKLKIERNNQPLVLFG
jgi:DNA (cytosine-5)-methyltransferase 1